MFELSIMEVDLMFAVAILASKTQRTADAALLLGASLWPVGGIGRPRSARASPTGP